MKTIQMNENKLKKSRGGTYKITPISLTNWPSITNLILNRSYEADLFQWLHIQIILFKYSWILMETLKIRDK